jgi:hypothetical protein
MWLIQSCNQIRLKKKQGKEKFGVTRLIRQAPVNNSVATR